jgi:hypothetical protein
VDTPSAFAVAAAHFKLTPAIIAKWAPTIEALANVEVVGVRNATITSMHPDYGVPKAKELSNCTDGLHPYLVRQQSSQS